MYIFKFSVLGVNVTILLLVLDNEWIINFSTIVTLSHYYVSTIQAVCWRFALSSICIIYYILLCRVLWRTTMHNIPVCAALPCCIFQLSLCTTQRIWTLTENKQACVVGLVTQYTTSSTENIGLKIRNINHASCRVSTLHPHDMYNISMLSLARSWDTNIKQILYYYQV